MSEPGRADRPGAARRLGLYGGTFDPIHVGHLIAATEVQAALGLDRVLFLPAGRPPHKRGREITPAAHRVRMIELAIAGRPGFGLSDLDLDPDRAAYTVHLLARAREAYGDGVELFFVMGEDQLRDLPTWHQPARVAELARLAVVTRPNVGVDPEEIARAVPAVSGRVHCVEIPQIDIASSDIRARVAAGRPIAYQVPRPVEDYILAHQLYRVLRAES
jgi:nicotinate-nucleotide adenylyltransferase